MSAAGDPMLARVTRGANWTLLVVAAATLALSMSLLVTCSIARANAKLTEMRCDFVSTVTHELKTPLATIRAVGDTLVRGRLTSERALTEYAQMLVQESKRLTRSWTICSHTPGSRT